MVDAFRADVYAGAYNRLELTLASAGFMLRTVTAEQYHAILEQRRRRRTYPHGIVFFRQKRVFFPPLLEALKALRATKGAPPVAAVCDWDDRPFYSFPRDMRVLSRPNLNTTNARALAVFLDEKSFVKPVFVIGRRDIFGRKPYAWDFGDVLKTWVEVRRLSRTSDFAVAVVDAAKGETLADTRIAPPNEEFDSMLSKFEPTSYADLSVHIGLYESVAEALRAHAKADVMVFQQDNHAAEALDLLQSQGRKVPEDVSAVSVDKSPAYLNRGFTRCELDQDSIGYLMAHAIIGDFAVPRTTKGFIRVNARVIEKLTTP